MKRTYILAVVIQCMLVVGVAKGEFGLQHAKRNYDMEMNITGISMEDYGYNNVKYYNIIGKNILLVAGDKKADDNESLCIVSTIDMSTKKENVIKAYRPNSGDYYSYKLNDIGVILDGSKEENNHLVYIVYSSGNTGAHIDESKVYIDIYNQDGGQLLREVIAEKSEFFPLQEHLNNGYKARNKKTESILFISQEGSGSSETIEINVWTRFYESMFKDGCFCEYELKSEHLKSLMVFNEDIDEFSPAEGKEILIDTAEEKEMLRSKLWNHTGMIWSEKNLLK